MRVLATLGSLLALLTGCAPPPPDPAVEVDDHTSIEPNSVDPAGFDRD